MNTPGFGGDVHAYIVCNHYTYSDKCSDDHSHEYRFRFEFFQIKSEENGRRYLDEKFQFDFQQPPDRLG